MDTREEAQYLQVLLCSRSYSGEYLYTKFGNELEMSDLDKLAAVFNEHYHRKKRRDKERQQE